MKAANSYGSLLRGVSQQVPQDRAEGQHTEQINMLSDPVAGLSRRHGSLWQGEQQHSSLPPAQITQYHADAANWASYDFDSGGKEYLVMYRKTARPVSANPLPLFVVYNKTDKVFLNYAPSADLRMPTAEANGIAAIAAVGKYLFFTANGVTVAGTSVQAWNSSVNYQRAVAWVRGGAYSRTFKITVRTQAGVSHTASYTTPSSSYQGVLDTSDIPYAAADYAKQVNDRVNAYNGAVTAWIGSATAAIQPGAIATQLGTAIGALVSGVVVIGSHITFTGAGVVKSIDVDDGGDGTLLRAVADEIESADKTSVIHYPGKVVKVRGKNKTDAYYLKAVAKDANVTAAYTAVTWIEGAGVVHTVTGGLYYATPVTTSFFVAPDAATLTALTAGSHPTFSSSAAGDETSAPAPFFLNRNVTYLGTFQNRLLVGSGGSLSVSETDEYLNFFRTTVLTLPASDPFSMLPQGSEDDEFRYSTLYDQDLVVFGKRRQYVVSGSVALTPTSANMPVMSSYENVAEAAPVSAGGFIFYAKRGLTHSNVFQIQPGQTDKSPESFPASSQVDTYIVGGIVEMTSFTGSPSTLLVRTNGAQNSMYTFSYLDKQDGRKMDAWSRWDFNTSLGVLLGMSVVPDGVVTVTLRLASDGKFYAVADFCPLTPGLSSRPYLDGQMEWALVSGGTKSTKVGSGVQFAAAFDNRSPRVFIGTPLPEVADLQASFPGEPGLVVGAMQDASVTLTNPFMRDGREKAIISGRLTISKLVMAFKASSGFNWLLKYRNTVTSTGVFNGRLLGDPTNVIGYEPVADGEHAIPIGRETREYAITVSARKWHPLTITAIEWVGQFFNRVQRF